MLEVSVPNPVIVRTLFPRLYRVMVRVYERAFQTVFRLLLWFIVSVLIVPLVAQAADSGGRFYMGGGAGGVTCPEYVRVMEQAKEHPPDSLEYVTKTSSFVMYVLGFRSGYNIGKSDTFDIFHGLSVEQILTWIELRCRENPLLEFGTVLFLLQEQVYPNRQRVAP